MNVFFFLYLAHHTQIQYTIQHYLDMHRIDKLINYVVVVVQLRYICTSRNGTEHQKN
jgi:hypothetical protein